jgi:hypothetical protein
MLRVTVRPWATIMVDGEVRARETDVPYSAPLPPGRHHVLAIHPFLGTRQATVTISPDATSDVVLDFNE